MPKAITHEAYRDSSGRLSQEGRQKALELFQAQKAIALSQIAISTAVAGMQAMASAPNFVLGIVQAALVTAAGIAQGALVASEQPQFFVGGVVGGAPDATTITAHAGESILTRRATSALGEDTVHALNRGMAPTGATVVVQTYKHRTLDRVLTDNARRAGSPLGRAVREGRDLAGWRSRKAA